MKSRSWCVVGLMVMAFGMTACGGDDDDGGGGGGGAALTACNGYCDKQQAANCGLYSSAAECKTTECEDTSAAPANCQNAIKTYYDCLNAQADVCADGCLDQFGAIIGACS